MEVKTKHKNPNAIGELVNRYKDVPQVAIGFPKGKATSTQYPDGTPVIDVAFYNNYGTKNKDGSDHIPARRFMDIGSKKATIELSPFIEKSIKKINDDQMTWDQLAEIVGIKAATILKKEITQLSEPPNADYTIAKKKSANPLIDTGLLRQTITYDIRKEEK